MFSKTKQHFPPKNFQRIRVHFNEDKSTPKKFLILSHLSGEEIIFVFKRTRQKMLTS